MASSTRYFRSATVLLAALIAATVLVAGLLVGHGTASAQSTAAFPGSIIMVNTKVDESNTDGDCSLREAIEAANTNAPVDGCKAGSATERDAIHFALGKKAKKIVLGTTLPAITDPSGLRISGREASITISGNEQVRVFEVAAGAELALLKLTVADGRSASFGGGLRNSGTVKVGNTTFSNNSASSVGGGILNDDAGTLTVSNTTFSNNSANQGGGGILNNGGGTLTVSNSTFSENSADFGGGIFNQVEGTLTMSNSTFSNNSANFIGGGIFNHIRATLTVSNSTFSNNSANFSGGGILNNGGGTLTMSNTTFSNNSANQGGGGILNEEGATATLSNTIVAYSASGSNCAGQIADGGFNIDDGSTCGFTEEQNSLPNTDPLLADQPADNGGPTKTIALLEGSPAINAIPEAENGCATEITTDQRGVSRPQGTGCDIGAYEKEQ